MLCDGDQCESALIGDRCPFPVPTVTHQAKRTSLNEEILTFPGPHSENVSYGCREGM